MWVGLYLFFKKGSCEFSGLMECNQERELPRKCPFLPPRTMLLVLLAGQFVVRRWEEGGRSGRRWEEEEKDTHKNNQLPWPPVLRRLARVLLSFFGSWLALGPLPNNNKQQQQQQQQQQELYFQ